MKPAFRKSRGIKLCRPIEITSAVVSIAQVIFSSITIYRARGDQIEKYGYAAYGLSVYPYALMSVANLIKLGVCGRYPYAYVLRTATLVEAEGKGGVFEGAVGNFGVNHGEGDKQVDDSQDSDSRVFSDPPSWLRYASISWLRPLGDYRGPWWIVPIVGSLILVFALSSQPVFIFLVSGFNARQSTRSQRVWMLGWLLANAYSANFVDSVVDSGWRRSYNPNCFVSFVSFVLVFLTYVFAFGGFVTVGRMLHAENNYQSC